MKLSIDAERCQGHGRCFELAPDLIDADDLGRGEVLVEGEDVPDALIDAARSAVRACPEGAITLS